MQDLIYPQKGRVVDFETYQDEQNRSRFAVILAAYSGGESFVLRPIDENVLAATTPSVPTT